MGFGIDVVKVLGWVWAVDCCCCCRRCCLIMVKLMLGKGGCGRGAYPITVAWGWEFGEQMQGADWKGWLWVWAILYALKSGLDYEWEGW